jgi:hypothetical protein
VLAVNPTREAQQVTLSFASIADCAVTDVLAERTLRMTGGALNDTLEALQSACYRVEVGE